MTDSIASLCAMLASVLAAGAFMFRDIMWIRGAVVLAALVAIISMLLMPQPFTVPVIVFFAAAMAMVLINLWAMRSGVPTAKNFTLSAEEMMLYARLPGLTPAQFQQLLAIAKWHNPDSEFALTEEGVMPSALYYVLEGRVNVTKNGKTFPVGPHAFIGELAFLRGKPATASTKAHRGALIVSWQQDSLRKAMKRDDGIRRALDSLLTVDMADKIARNGPPLLQEQSA